MNRDENIAREYLCSLGIGAVIHEPDGNCPPDFLIDGRIAVEVRRLNQHYLANGKFRGLEEDTIPLWQSMEKLLAEFGSPKDGKTWFVSLHLKRPYPQWKSVCSSVRSALNDFLANPSKTPLNIPIANGFHLRLALGSTTEDTIFCMGSSTDEDAGGWVVSEIVRNMQAYIDEKTQKVERVRRNYATWWLMFIDYIGYGNKQEEVRKYIKKPAVWDKVFVVSPMNDAAYEI